MPPQSSSHTDATDRHVIRVTRLSLVAVLVLLVCVSFPALGWPALFGWLFLLPIGAAAWVLRSRTTLTPAGLETHSLFGSRDIAWSDIKGVRFPKRGWARADLGDGQEAPLPAVTFDRIRDLSAASGGRIPDPYAAAPTPADDSETGSERE